MVDAEHAFVINEYLLGCGERTLHITGLPQPVSIIVAGVQCAWMLGAKQSIRS